MRVFNDLELFYQARIQKILNPGAKQYELSGWTGGRKFIHFLS